MLTREGWGAVLSVIAAIVSIIAFILVVTN